MTNFIYVDVTNGIIDTFPCPVEEIQPMYENFYNERFHIEHYELLGTNEDPYVPLHMERNYD